MEHPRRRQLDRKCLFDGVKKPLSLANFEDRKAELLLQRDETNYQAAIECHERAYQHLRTVQLHVYSKNIYLHTLTDSESLIMDSLYTQLEKHTTMQSVLLGKQGKAIMELKHQPYLASIKERAARLANADVLINREKVHRQISEHDILLETLKEKINQENTALKSNLSNEGKIDDEEVNLQVRMSKLEMGSGRTEGNVDETTKRTPNRQDVGVDRINTHTEILNQLAETSEKERESPSTEIGQERSGNSSFGVKKPKSLQDTFEELKKMNEQFKQLVANLVGENIRLKEELEAQHQYIIQQKFFTVKDASLDAGDMAESGASEESPNSLSKPLHIPPLSPVGFEVPDEELRRLNNTD